MAKLYFYYAAMNAGKSTTLLQSAHNYEERNMRTLLFTPKLDDRFGEDFFNIVPTRNEAVDMVYMEEQERSFFN